MHNKQHVRERRKNGANEEKLCNSKRVDVCQFKRDVARVWASGFNAKF